MSNSVLKGMSPRVQGNIPAKEQFSLNDSTNPRQNSRDCYVQLLRFHYKHILVKYPYVTHSRCYFVTL